VALPDLGGDRASSGVSLVDDFHLKNPLLLNAHPAYSLEGPRLANAPGDRSTERVLT